MSKQFLIGNQIIVKAALAAKAEILFGYPITPTTEIMSEWVKVSEKNSDDKIKFLQTEDEMSAGFAMIGAVLGGKKAFTATSGPGNILIQDPMAMAEAMRLPTVTIIMQRGGPSTGTVIYSQQELILTTHGGNGEGMRIVYAPSNLQELYDLTIQAFNAAWQYRFPVFILGDGYLAKMQGEVELWDPAEKNVPIIEATAYFGDQKKLKIIKENQPTAGFKIQKQSVNLRNCFNTEEEILKVNLEIQKAFQKIAPEITASEIYPFENPETIIIAYGIVAAAVKQALRENKAKNITLFRPITLSPFPKDALRALASKAKKILVLESSLGQLSSIIKNNLYGLTIPIQEFFKPGLGFSVAEIKKILL